MNSQREKLFGLGSLHRHCPPFTDRTPELMFDHTTISLRCTIDLGFEDTLGCTMERARRFEEVDKSTDNQRSDMTSQTVQRPEVWMHDLL